MQQRTQHHPIFYVLISEPWRRVPATKAALMPCNGHCVAHRAGLSCVSPLPSLSLHHVVTPAQTSAIKPQVIPLSTLTPASSFSQALRLTDHRKWWCMEVKQATFCPKPLGKQLPAARELSCLLPESSRQAGSCLLPETSWQGGSFLLPETSRRAGSYMFPRALGEQVATCCPRALLLAARELSCLLPESSRQAGSCLLPETSRQGGSYLLPETSRRAGSCYLLPKNSWQAGSYLLPKSS
ncbi:hypothetical protein PCASD_12374 [Puccinia coronata f. sp. avenae]|uniref:Uncharacterized protein n=1 Tax=Puccinia coronata f. sp. avenae TaxID=200324 RepID=A0A2N5TDQ5_9BASI|nr:hypothetical protein PCASD_12374 [Puccinia coronata f. sp. avenae]